MYRQVHTHTYKHSHTCNISYEYMNAHTQTILTISSVATVLALTTSLRTRWTAALTKSDRSCVLSAGDAWVCASGKARKCLCMRVYVPIHTCRQILNVCIYTCTISERGRTVRVQWRVDGCVRCLFARCYISIHACTHARSHVCC
jgi:hypothetical protein